MLMSLSRPFNLGSGGFLAALGVPSNHCEHGAERSVEHAGRGRQPARHLGTQHALLAAALGTASGCSLGAAHRPCSSVGKLWEMLFTVVFLKLGQS